MDNERLGLLRAVVIVFVSGLVVGYLVPLLVPTSFLWTTIGPSGGGRFDWTSLILWEAVIIVFQAIAVMIGVYIVGFRVSFASAAFAFALTTVIGFAFALAVGYVTISTTADDPTGISGAAFSSLFFLPALAIGLLLPAYLINAAARPESERQGAEPSYPPLPPYPPYPPESRQ